MRLICPNCGAQYEVPEDVIPENGRDVQCSNCGDTWFQPSAQMLADQNEAESPPAAPARQPEPEPEPEPEYAEPEPDPVPEPRAGPADPAPEPAPVAEPEPEPAEETWPRSPAPEAAEAQEQWHEDPDAPEHPEDTPAYDDTPEPEPEPEPVEAHAAAPAKRRLDPEISRVLREEAMREEALRSGRDGLETQTEMGLDDLSEDEATRRARQSQERVARMRGEEPAATAEPVAEPAADRPAAAERPAPHPGSRRGLLPDIEEVATDAPGEPKSATPPPVDVAAPAPRKSGFSRGFILVILLMVVAILAYSKAPVIAERLPQADPYISSYVAWVDQWRLWLDEQAKALAAE
ncbi:zinc-ribbon domain-containing protein [Tritonibacter mobilis]|uniref:zinc-ribbon domain-containing protein n=1 Tax=Tritonibacter mobilis TaxID=379347 RepID=UPI001403B7B2|nr:zinc-ribbon domain-containing protein [Tritonibacter mobilis]NHM17180.1 thioredoxin [Tritonibacter mobilis]NHM21369.1 thioredoxin [Tritonibacter mobilis]